MTATTPQCKVETEDDMVHETIWLQPWCVGCDKNAWGSDGRQWCEDDPWGDCEECGRKAVKYTRALPESTGGMVNTALIDPLSEMQRTSSEACENCDFFSMLWKWFEDESRMGAEGMRPERLEGLSADDFKTMLDEHEAALQTSPAEPVASDDARLDMRMSDATGGRELAAALRKECGASNGCSCADMNYQWYGPHCEARMTSVFRSMLKDAATSPVPSTLQSTPSNSGAGE